MSTAVILIGYAALVAKAGPIGLVLIVLHLAVMSGAIMGRAKRTPPC